MACRQGKIARKTETAETRGVVKLTAVADANFLKRNAWSGAIVSTDGVQIPEVSRSEFRWRDPPFDQLIGKLFAANMCQVVRLTTVALLPCFKCMVSPCSG